MEESQMRKDNPLNNILAVQWPAVDISGMVWKAGRWFLKQVWTGLSMSSSRSPSHCSWSPPAASCAPLLSATRARAQAQACFRYSKFGCFVYSTGWHTGCPVCPGEFDDFHAPPPSPESHRWEEWGGVGWEKTGRKEGNLRHVVTEWIMESSFRDFQIIIPLISVFSAHKAAWN